MKLSASPAYWFLHFHVHCSFLLSGQVHVKLSGRLQRPIELLWTARRSMLMKWKNPKTPDGWMPGEITLEGKTEKERPLPEACTTAAMRTHTHPKWSVTGLPLSTSYCSFHLYTGSTSWTVGLWKTIQISLKNKQQSAFFMLSTAEETERLKNETTENLLPGCQDIEQQAAAFTEGKRQQDKTLVERLPKSLCNCAN